MQEKIYLKLYPTLFEFYSIQEQIILQKNEYWRLYHTFLESWSIQEQILMHEVNYVIFVAVRNDSNVPPFSRIVLSHICWVLKWSGTYLNRWIWTLLFCYKNNKVVKNNNKITTNTFLFLLRFCLVSSRHSHNCYI